MNNLIDGTITDFDEGDLVNGTVVKIEHDEVLVDIGFKSEGVIPVRELSIRKDANPADIVALGDPIEALVLQKEDKDGRLVLSKKRAEYERAWNRIEEKFNSGENVEGEVIEVVKGGDITKGAFTLKDDTGIMVNSDFLNGLTVKEAIPAMKQYAIDQGSTVQYGGTCWWWLREGYFVDLASIPNLQRANFTDSGGTVRPVMWVDAG